MDDRAMEQSLAAARAQLERQEAALRRMEWVNTPNGPICSWCRNDADEGHAAWCGLLPLLYDGELPPPPALASSSWPLDPPTEPGFYWAQSPDLDEPTIARVLGNPLDPLVETLAWPDPTPLINLKGWRWRPGARSRHEVDRRLLPAREQARCFERALG